MSELTSKCRRKVCQAESGVWRDLFCGEDHIFYGATATAAIGGVDVPVCGADILAGRVAEGAGDAINRGGAAFEFEEGADGCFIQVQVETVQVESAAVLFVAEGWLEAQCGEGGGPVARVMWGDFFPFGTFFVTAILPGGVVLARGCLGREDYAPDADAVDAGSCWRCGLDADAEEAATVAQIGMGCVVESVGFERAALGDRA